MEIRDIVGSNDSQNIQTFGQFFFKTTEISTGNNEVELLIQMRNIPPEVVQSNAQGKVQIPQQLRILTAKRSIDGLDYEYEPIGVIIFDEPVENLRSGKFSTILEQNITSVERIVFVPEDEGVQNVFTDTSPDRPPQVRSRPAPFFWSEL
jgi:alpha-D-ribose 1-methylphosphonate 5-phosphate C-P lyase